MRQILPLSTIVGRNDSGRKQAPATMPPLFLRKHVAIRTSRNHVEYCRMAKPADSRTKSTPERSTSIQRLSNRRNARTSGPREVLSAPFKTCAPLLAAVVTMVVCAATYGQTKDDIIAGAVRLKNGVILRGMCSSGHSLSAATLADSRLDLRKIDQGYRVYYVAVPQSEPIVPDNLVIPDKSYKIYQRATSQQPLNYSIGLHQRAPFGPDGKSKVSLNLGGGQKPGH